MNIPTTKFGRLLINKIWLHYYNNLINLYEEKWYPKKGHSAFEVTQLYKHKYMRGIVWEYFKCHPTLSLSSLNTRA